MLLTAVRCSNAAKTQGFDVENGNGRQQKFCSGGRGLQPIGAPTPTRLVRTNAALPPPSFVAGATLSAALSGESEASEAAHHQHAQRQRQGDPGPPRGKSGSEHFTTSLPRSAGAPPPPGALLSRSKRQRPLPGWFLGASFLCFVYDSLLLVYSAAVLFVLLTACLP